jgi:hypothetical protein
MGSLARGDRPVKLRALMPALLLLVALAALAGCGGGGSETPTLPSAKTPAIGLQDDRLGDPTVDPGGRMAQVHDLGAQVVRIDLHWFEVAPRRPKNPRDPEDPAYDWTHYDQVVTAAEAEGVPILFSIWGTPQWAVDPSVKPTKSYPYWSSRPRRPQDAGDFAAAAAARYGPRGIHLWEAWNEPNIPLFMRPQYERQGGRWVPSSPRVYTEILRAMYRGIKASDPKATVGGGVTAPAGEASAAKCTLMPDCRIQPIDFVEDIAKPGERPPMDVYSHHPYPLRKPSSFNLPNASYIDLYNLPRLERALDATYLKGKPLWLTEFGFGTKPVPNYKFFVTPAQQAAYLTDAVNRVRANPRVKIFIWYFMQDNSQWASGLVREDGTRKPAADAFTAAAGGS